MEMAMGCLVGGNMTEHSVPCPVTVPPEAMRPEEKMVRPQFAHAPEPRAVASGRPAWPLGALAIHFFDAGSGRKPPCHGGSGFSLKVPLVHSRMVTRSTGK